MADNTILNRLDGLKLKYEETGQKLTDPEVIADVKQFIQLTKEYKELEPIIETSNATARPSPTSPKPRTRWPRTRTRRCAKWPAR